MDIFGILTMIGGLALFLYGMDIMGEGLSKASGGKLERILEKLTSNPIKAVLLGAGVTAVIQSSSATTVMVVGFVNSGIMKLSQAVGIIMGANIGTTATSWLLSLTGIQSGNVFVRLLNPSSFSPVLAVIGVIFIMFSKREKLHDIGKIMVGFAILMTGMSTMSDAVKPLAQVKEFTNILTMFSNPVLGMLAGAVLTAVIQSSSASVGILQALCATGSITYATALPVIMGQNIGTCVTALLSGIGASRNAKRAALVHLYFNIIGTVLFMCVFYIINVFNPFAFLSEGANPAGIAVIHSIFNITATIVLLPFSKGLEKLAYLTVKKRGTCKIYVYAKEDEHYERSTTVSIKVKIVPGKIKKIHLKRISGRKLKVTWKKDTRYDGYWVDYGTKKNMLDSRQLTINNSNKNRIYLKNLKHKKKYYVIVRGYKKIKKGKRYIPEFSPVNKLTITI